MDHKPEALRVRMLGGFSVGVGSRTIGQDEWHLRRAAALVKLLALAPNHRLHREQIIDLLWPHLGRRAASNNLRRTLHATRRVLDHFESSRYLVSEEGWLALCPARELWVDVEAFEEAAVTARREGEPAAYRAAIELYAGELLPTDRYEEWAEDRRQQLRLLDLALLEELASIYEERGEYGAAIEAFRRVTAEEPSREEAHTALMRLYALVGNQAEALRQYELLEAALTRELEVEPNASSRALREEIASGRFPVEGRRERRFPLEDPASIGRHNLPAPRTSFVGRQTEMVEVKRDLAMTRLLTLTGAGGCGKTRLALEVARDLVTTYPDGVWLVELAPLSEDELVPKALAEAVGTQEIPGRRITDALVESMRHKERLVVMDNCEHLIEATALLVDTLLYACPRLRVLATSREPLDVAGELNWPVPSLSVPDKQPSTCEEVEGYEAVRLFVDRARHRNPAFSFSSEVAPAVARICERLEGIPLAIELAAARVGLSVEQIASRLDDSLGLLTVGNRTASPRQRTLRGTLDWSHALLSEPERGLFGRLSVFAGGWTLEAAEAVGAGDTERGEVFDLLSRLVAKSLVVAEATGGGGVRYRMLEPIRQYALEKLEEGGEFEEVRLRHASFFLALAEEAEPKLVGPEDAEWLERLETEHDNIRAALSWVLEGGETELGLRLAGALWLFWEAHGHYGEGRGWLEEVLEKGGQASVAARAKALEGLGWAMYRLGDTDRAKATGEEGLRLSGEGGLGGVVTSDFLRMLGGMAEVQGHRERSRELVEESLELSREADDKLRIAYSLLELGITMGGLGDLKRAKESYEEGIVLSREIGYAAILARFLLSLGAELLFEGDYERGAALNEEAATLLREHGYKGGSLELALNNLGLAALWQGDHERARTSYKESLILCKELGNKWIAFESLEGLACICAVEGASEQAARLFGAAEALREAVSRHVSEDDAWREPYLAAARSRLDEAAWEVAWAEGRTMSMEQAIDHALSEEMPVTLPSPDPEQPSSEEPSGLTRREEEVAVLVGRGLTNRRIASELFLSEHTVHHHITNILKKLNLTSRQQVASRLPDR